jgi:glycerol-3-phosphate dehydrogenase
MIDLDSNWDVIIVVGGGITGAGIFRETIRMGLKSLLLEQQDFAWGTSSRSSKLVHGGLRYLKEGRIFLIRDAVRERERLLAEARGLVLPMGFLVPVYKDRGPGRWALEAGCPFTT